MRESLYSLEWDKDIKGWTKRCSRCHKKYVVQAETWEEAYAQTAKFFSRDDRTQDELCTQCKECRGHSSRGRIPNGMSREDMLMRQNSKCFICQEEMGLDGHRGAVVDHNPRTGVIRKVLCPNCNRGLGQFKDNADLLYKAAQYIRDHE